MAVSREVLGIAATAVATLLVAICSIPAGASHFGRRKYRPLETETTENADSAGLYRDQDGVAKEPSSRPGFFSPMSLLIGSVCMGIGATVAGILVGREFSTFTWHYVSGGLEASAWGVSLWARMPSVGVSNLIPCALVSSVVLIASILFRGMYATNLHPWEPKIDIRYILFLVEAAAALLAFVSSSNIPRRPDVYFRDGLVDRQLTRSYFSRWWFSWATDLVDRAQTRRLELEDLPYLDSSLRAEQMNARYLAANHSGRLLWKLLMEFRGPQAQVWLLRCVMGSLKVLPRYLLMELLQVIERRQDGRIEYGILTAWVLALGTIIVVDEFISAYLDWIATTKLSICTNYLLSTLVFQKAMRLYQPANFSNQDEGGGEAKESGKGKTTPKDDADPKASKDSKNADNVKGTNGDTDNKAEAKLKKPQGTKQSIVNHMKLDARRVTMFFHFSGQFPYAGMQLFFGCFLLVRLLGWKAPLVGCTASLLVLPISSYLSKRFSASWFGMFHAADKRSNTLMEVMQGMRQIKMSGTEDLWESRLLKPRQEELARFWKLNLLKTVVVFVMDIGPVVLTTTSLAFYALTGGEIKSSILFPAIGLFYALYESIQFIPFVVVYMMEAFVSIKRLENFFAYPEKANFIEPGEQIELRNATVVWPKDPTAEGDNGDEDTRGMLENITLAFPNEELSIVCGKTGSGKSLLLATLLGEVELVSGSVRVPRCPSHYDVDYSTLDLGDENWVMPSAIAFVSQTPWIEGGTVRENVVFGLPFNEDRYRRVLRACALDPDIRMLVDGEHTEIGPKGVTLSGGQRWRLALARALYSRAGIILLDDVLSAVDTHVGRWLADNALTGEIARGRTRILATHHAELCLPAASYLVRLKDGRVDSAETLTPDLTQTCHPLPSPAPSTPTGEGPGAGGASTEPSGPLNKTTKDEERAEGRVGWHVYTAYFKAGGGWLYWLPAVLAVSTVPGMRLIQTLTLKWWTEAVAENENEDTQLFRVSHFQQVMSEGERHYDSMNISYVALYIGISVALAVMQSSYILAWDLLGIRAAKVLFSKMTYKVLRAPLRWIDTTPSGRIVNRFTSDINIVDIQFASRISIAAFYFVGILVSLGTSLAVAPYIIALAALLSWLYYKIAGRYVTVARELKRLGATMLSPIYDQFSTAVVGLITIRAFNRTNNYVKRCYWHIDNRARVVFYTEYTAKWLSIRMGLLSAMYVLVVTFAVAFSQTSAPLAGFTLSFALDFSSSVMSLLQRFTEIEVDASAVERVVEYAELPTEDDLSKSPGTTPPAAWPASGSIKVENLSVAYDESLPPALKDVSFSIPSGKRVGVVGRTGAGKSSLALALFRLLEPRTGRIRVDGLDISAVKRSDLRKRLAIVPQDPFLFSGTLRSNLDMAGQKDDYELLNALQQVQLVSADAEDGGETEVSSSSSATIPGDDPAKPAGATRTADIFKNLSLPVAQGGDNFSQGQRQLVCLARALLSRPKVVVLDEATSSVDSDTGAQVLRGAVSIFPPDSTVILIAHRLSTIAAVDIVLVLSEGRLVEMGPPAELLGTEGGMFWELVQKSSEREELMKTISRQRGLTR